jgi:hypothetical protein
MAGLEINRVPPGIIEEALRVATPTTRASVMHHSGFDFACTGGCTLVIQILGAIAHNAYPVVSTVGAFCGAILGVAGVYRLIRDWRNNKRKDRPE